MSEHLLIDPNELYKLYDYRDVKEYYNFTFLADFTSIEIDIFYDVLNSLSMRDLSNLNLFIFKQVSLTNKIIEVNKYTPKYRHKQIISRQYNNDKVFTKEDFNNKLQHYIQNDQIISLFIMNQLIKFLYPCK